MILAFFLSTSHPDTSYQVLSLMALLFRKSSKQIFKLATVAAILDFQSEINVPYKAEYNLHLSTNRTLIFQPKFGEKNEVDRIKHTQK